jgi:nucleoside-diphosphate-sugar epimerase
MASFLVTGATGFVGRALSASLAQQGNYVRLAVRQTGENAAPPHQGTVCGVGNIGAETDWDEALDGIETVFHLAARVHIMHERADNGVVLFRETNLAGTERLAHAAAIAGVRRFIYLSSIKVNGEHTVGHPFSESDTPAPQDPYAISKWEAEQSLWRIAEQSGMEVVIIRPPLIYGPGVKANFLRLLGWLHRGIPLPLASVNNQRSLIFLDNLVDALISCASHANAANQTFLVSDGQDVSSPEMIRMLAAAMGKSDRLWPVPLRALRALGWLTGRITEVDRLVESLQIDSSKIRRELGWMPPFSMEEGFRKTVAWYLAEINGS